MEGISHSNIRKVSTGFILTACLFPSSVEQGRGLPRLQVRAK
jgi:hypothetical protein